MVSKDKENLDRWEKVKNRTSHMRAIRESYNPIVPLKRANEGPQSRRWRDYRSEESGQERGLAKGNAVQSPAAETQSSGKKVSRGLIGVREAAERDRQLKFTTLLHHIAGKLKELKAELRRRYHQPVPVQGKWLSSAYRGFVNYFAVPGNMPTLKSFHHQLCRIWLKALRRRSQKGKRLTWEKFVRIYPEWLPQPRCKHPWPNQRFGRHYPRQEPYAVVPHVRVCMGGVP